MKNLIAALMKSVEPGSLMARIAEQTCVFLPKADGAAVSLCTDDYLTIVSAHGISESMLGNVLPAQGTFQALALETGLPQCSSDATQDDRLHPQVREIAERLGIRSWVTIPLYHQEKALGALTVVAKAAEAFNPIDVVGIASMGRFVSLLLGSHSEMGQLLTDFLTDPTTVQDSPATHFLASFLVPHLARTDDITDRVESLLRDAHNFQAVFQPVVDLQSGQTLGFEGLCRFPSTPAAGLTTNNWFEEARRVGRGNALEVAALRAVLDAAKGIPEKFDVGVNLSPLAALTPEVQSILMSADRQLVLELTEHERFPDDLSAGLKPLRDNGIIVAVDDAGAGFASFTQILRLCPDIIKLDGEIIRGIERDSVKRALAASVVQFAAELGAIPVAESIENSEQKEVVYRLGIPRGQGYFIGRPCGAAELFPAQ
ncbi:MAG: EAL domain-containing protein [Mycobacterium sp.]|nr:EAL domain-containing protein [Mycobacterium sp.]